LNLYNKINHKTHSGHGFDIGMALLEEINEEKKTFFFFKNKG
jgi:hypothetical protein